MGSGNIDVGKSAPTRQTGRPIIEGALGKSTSSDLQADKLAKIGPPAFCGAMAEQCDRGGHGNYSSPQGLVRLVGCREVDAASRRRLVRDR